jgi:outer membrane cobalamin receptor
MSLSRLFFLVLFLLSYISYAQDSLHITIDEVVISDNHLIRYSQTQKGQKISDSTAKRSSSFLTSLLNYNTLIYFKENGVGGASSAAFRGTTAQHTAVVWNGININSQTLGQTDFNTINPLAYNSITVRAGGGSVIYGSSAIGGSIHLNNDLRFGNRFDNELVLRYGSFDTFDGSYSTNIASEVYSLHLGFNHSQSENDYEWIGKKRKNQNGEYQNSSFNSAFGYKINSSNSIKFYTQYSFSDRHFSLVTPTEVPTKYQNFDVRNFVEWTATLDRATSRLKLAHLQEEYRYFPNIRNLNYTFGKVESLIAKYDFNYSLSPTMNLGAVFDFTQNKGEGSSISHHKRQIRGGSLLFQHSVTQKLFYEFSLRQEITDNYQSPFLYALGIKYDVDDLYSLKLNTSKNFRIPTFNDLYWQTGGNENLNPETSQQVELTHELKWKQHSVYLTGYYNHIQDMLRWIPSSSIWTPINTSEVEIFGIETGFATEQYWGEHKIVARANYGFTSSKDKPKDKYLIYVPLHKANATLGYAYKYLNLYAEYLYVGEVYTRSDNNPKYNMDAYQLVNLGGDYTFYKKYTLGLKVQNLLNTYYENVENRALPGRSYMMYLNMKF